MSKLIIYVGGKPAINGFKRREFVWSDAHKCFIYGGTEIDERDFNAKCEKAFRNNQDLNPQVKVVAFSDEPTITVQPPSPPMPDVTTITVAREISLAEAESVVARLAPDRLKKTPGRKPRIMEVA